MKRRISSHRTVAFKWLIPALMAAAVVMGIGSAIRNLRLGRPLTWTQVLGVALYIAAAVTSVRWARRLKHVFIDGTTLEIVHMTKRIHVSAADIATVREILWGRSKAIAMTFTHETAFGWEVVFISKLYFDWKTIGNPTIKELKESKALARIGRKRRPKPVQNA